MLGKGGPRTSSPASAVLARPAFTCLRLSARIPRELGTGDFPHFTPPKFRQRTVTPVPPFCSRQDVRIEASTDDPTLLESDEARER
ncbi:short transient receptor potential channel 7-like protein [Lates japonicus]|uniref:Short transient receptor potential channel 7-like protein n=1 Tax=Lates japonicus TaxID=270547 RepID=A0AAD3RGC4_LATJO|nr:short transient receptor potential channel 7-like protein [Lates japonicus]